MANQSGKMENLVTADNLSTFYKGKKVFLTGHTGFKGAWLTACLHQLGAQVKGYALPPEDEQGIFNMLAPLPGASSVLADIRDRSRLREEIELFQPDYIFHLAAQPLVRRSYEIPAETFDVNVTGTANLLEAATAVTGKCTIVVITTDKVYENKEQDILYEEDDRLGGYDPYSASKACTELVVSAFRSSFFNPAHYARHHKAIASARAGNVIGGGDFNKDRIIPDVVRALQQQKTVEVRNPAAVRPWQHVLEPLIGYLELGALLSQDPVKYSTAYNFGPLPKDHLTVEQLVKIALDTWGHGTWRDCSTGEQPHEAGLLKLSVERACREIGWRPRLDAATAISWTMKWYKTEEAQKKDFTFQQIRDYFAL